MATEVSIDRARVQAFFDDLESRNALLTTITELHKALRSHLTKIDQTLNEKSMQLDFDMKAFSEKTKNALENLRNREDALPNRESCLAERVQERKAAALAEIESTEELGDLSEKSLAEVLRFYCRRMDAHELVRFMVALRKHQTALKYEVAAAAEESIDSMRLVLDAVEELVAMKVNKIPGIADRRWACLLLIQSVVPVKEGCVVGRSLRERAAEVLEKWKGMFGGGEGTGGAVGTEVVMFLQMVIGFGLKEKFGVEFLRKLVVEFATRRDMPKIAVAMGFGEKLVDIVNELVRSGKEIEAVYFASESGMTEQFSPVSLLKSCLQNCRESAKATSKKGNYSASAVEKANNLELGTVKAIVKCVEDHNLESEFTIDDLKKRIRQLEKAKPDKRNAATSTRKISNKRPRGDMGISGPSFRPPKSGRFLNEPSSLHLRNPSQLHQVPPAIFSGPYSYTSQAVYDGPGKASYSTVYGGAQSQSPVALPQQYAYMPQDVGSGGVRVAGPYGGQGSYGGQSNVAGSYGGQSTYGAYDYGATSQAYPPSYPPH